LNDELLRRELRAIVEDSPFDPAIIEHVVRSGRRRRMLYRSFAALAAAGFVAALAVVVVDFGSINAPGGPAQVTPGASGATSTRGAPESASPARTHEPGPTGPASPVPNAVVGIGYAFNLYTHCGIRYASFDSRNWVAFQPMPGIPDGWDNPYQSGTMTLVKADVARFAGPRGIVFNFIPTSKTIPVCH